MNEQNLERHELQPEEASGIPLSQNHLLSDWINVYVKETCRIKGFKADPKTISKMLDGIVPLERIQKSLDFLVKEGFLKKTEAGKFVDAEPLTVTTDGPRDLVLHEFHKKALDITRKAMDRHDHNDRQSGTILMHINKKNVEGIKNILKETQAQLNDFMLNHPNDDQTLYQIILNMCPITKTVSN